MDDDDACQASKQASGGFVCVPFRSFSSPLMRMRLFVLACLLLCLLARTQAAAERAQVTMERMRIRAFPHMHTHARRGNPLTTQGELHSAHTSKRNAVHTVVVAGAGRKRRARWRVEAVRPRKSFYASGKRLHLHRTSEAGNPHDKNPASCWCCFWSDQKASAAARYVACAARELLLFVLAVCA